MSHAIRRLMEPGSEGQPPLSGIVELDEKYFGGKPRYEHGVKHMLWSFITHAVGKQLRRTIDSGVRVPIADSVGA